MTSTSVHERLSALIQSHGVSLTSGGSSELGFSRDVAICAVELLIEGGYPVYGIEVWRAVAAGHCIDSLGGWYSQSDEPKESALEAREFLISVPLGKHDVVTIQSSVPF